MKKSQQQIDSENYQQGNRIIAEFMGYTLHNHGSYKTFEKNDRHVFDSVLTYHVPDRWANLMEVIDKIEQVTVKIYSENVPIKVSIQNIIRTDKKPMVHECVIQVVAADGHRIQVYHDTKIITVWTAVVSFIVWYNEVK